MIRGCFGLELGCVSHGLRRLAIFFISTFCLLPEGGASEDDGGDTVAWVESEVVLPSFVTPVKPIRIDLGPTADNFFSVDAATLSVGTDGVVRFIMQVVSSSGAVTVTYEGIRCDTRELRRYAFGRSDGSWSRSRSGRWERIQAKSINSYASVLYREYFCPGGMPLRSTDEALVALRRGGFQSVLP